MNSSETASWMKLPCQGC